MGTNLNNDVFIRVAGSSVAGRSHIAKNKPCEDAWASSTCNLANNCRAVVVCDGAGSKPKGKIGADITSHLMAQWLVENFENLLRNQESEPEIKKLIIETIQNAIKDYIASTGIEEDILDYSCTFLGVVMDNQNRWLACHIGDGGIVAKGKEGTFLVSGPYKGEFVNVTFFVTESDSAENLNISFGNQPAYSFALFSDGLEKSLIQAEKGLIAPVLDRMLDWLLENSEEEVCQAIHDNLNDVFSLRTTDDCTLAMITCNYEQLQQCQTVNSVVYMKHRHRRLKKRIRRN